MNGTLTRFKPGDQRINRRGRPKAGHSIQDYISVKTKHGRALVDFYWQIFTDQNEAMELRLKAAEKLEYRLLGKPAQETPISVEGAGALAAAAINLTINVDPFSRPDE